MKALSFLKDAVTPVTHDKMVRRIRSWLHSCNMEDWDAGIRWYADANAFCETIAVELGFDLEGVAHCLATLSPQQSWETNKRNTVLVATILSDDISIFATGVQKRNAINALERGYRIPETSIKTHCFADNIANPDSTRVTVDRHAVKAALNDLTAAPIKITPKRYAMVERAYQAAAKEFNIMPYQAQAIVWLAYKRRVNR